MAKRSFPHVGLERAVERVRAVYDEDHRNEMAGEVIARHLGYEGITGTSGTMISSLKKFGLLEGRGDSVRVSDDAVTILVDERQSLDRVKAIQSCASKPDLFRDLDSKFPNGGSERNIRIYLERQGLKAPIAQIAADAYRETRDYLTAETSWYSEDELEPEVSPETELIKAPVGSATSSPGDGMRDIQLPLSEGTWPVLRGIFPMTERSWEQMLALLKAMKPGLVLPKESDSEEGTDGQE